MDILKFSEGVFNNINNTTAKVLYYNVMSLFGVNKIEFPLVMFVGLVGCIVFMLRLRFIQIVQFIPSFRFLFGRERDSATGGEGEISSIKALFSVVAGATGLGAIVGTISGISIAGPGVVFWILITPLIGMPLKFAEVFVGHKYRKKIDGVFTGGPSWYIKEGLADVGLPRLGSLFAILYSLFVVFGSLSGGSSYQVNQVTKIVMHTFPVLAGKEIIISLVFTALVALVILGGAARVATILAFVAPITVGSYFVCTFIVLCYNYTKIIPSIALVLQSAFDIKVAFTGIFASFIIGFCRTMMATETGLGTAATMHATSSNPSSVKEGILSMSSSVIVTFCVCFMSSLAVLVTDGHKTGDVGVLLLTHAFSSVSKNLSLVVMIVVPVMASNVAIAWSLYGARSMQYIFGPRSGFIYKVIFLAFAFGGGVISDFLVLLKFADVAITSIFLPNIIALILMSGMISREYKNYLKKK